MDREIFTMISELRCQNQITRNKIDELIISGIGSSEIDEMRAILIEAEEIRKAQEVLDDFESFPDIEEELENLKSQIKVVMKDLRDFRKRVDEFEEKFLKYNVPSLHESESVEDYAERLRAFMVIWKEEAKKGREKGEKSLIEWLRFLDQSDDEERKATFKDMKAIAIHLGIYISRLLSETFLFMSVSANGEEIKQNRDDFIDILECLSVEDNSIVIDMFVYVMDFAERSMRLRELQCSGMDHVSLRFKKKDIFRLIIREVLRLEVALCCPDLPMMLINEVFLAMGVHLRLLSDKKLDRICTILNELKSESRLYFRDEEVDKVNFITETMELGISAIWNRLNLKPESNGDQSDN